MTVLVRRASDCAVRGRLQVDLTKTRGIVRFTGRLHGQRLARGVYVLTISRAQATSPLRQIVVRVARQGRVTRIHRSGVFCLFDGNGQADMIALMSGNAHSVGVGAGTGGGGGGSARGSGVANRPPVGGSTAGANTFHLATPRDLSDAAGGGVLGTILALVILALLVACPLAIGIYIWQFLRTPAAP